MNKGLVKVGVYYIIDPSYVFSQDDDRFLWDCEARTFSSFCLDGFPIHVWSTKNGPGCYPLYYMEDNLRMILENIPTDSGKLALVPKELIETTNCIQTLHERVGTHHEVAYPIILNSDVWINLTVGKQGDIGIGNYVSVSSSTDSFDDSKQSTITDFYETQTTQETQTTPCETQTTLYKQDMGAHFC